MCVLMLVAAVDALDIDERSEADAEADFNEDAWLPLGGVSLCRPGAGGGARRAEEGFAEREFDDDTLDGGEIGGDEPRSDAGVFRAGSFGGSCLIVLAMKSHSCVEDKLGLDMLADDIVSNERASSKLELSKSMSFRFSKLESPVLFEPVVNC